MARIRSLVAMTVGIAVLMLSGRAVGEVSAELPSQVDQTTRPYRPKSTAVQPEQHGDSETLEIPQAVKGCWEATVVGPPDSYQYIKGPPSVWMSTKRTLCFIETPSHSFQVTFQAFGADVAGAASRGHSVTDVKSTVEVLGGDGKGNFTLRTVSSDRQKVGTYFHRSLIEYTTITKLECIFEGDTLITQATTFSSCTGAPPYCDGGPMSTSTKRVEWRRVDATEDRESESP